MAPARFVNTIAWLGIVGCALGALLNTFAWVLVTFFLPEDSMSEVSQVAVQFGVNVLSAVRNMGLILAIGCVLQWLGVWVAVALLKRKNWARVALLIYLAVTTLSFSMGLIPGWWFPWQGFGVYAANAFFILLYDAFHIWLFYKFRSEPMLKEFGVKIP